MSYREKRHVVTVATHQARQSESCTDPDTQNTCHGHFQNNIHTYNTIRMLWLILFKLTIKNLIFI